MHSTVPVPSAIRQAKTEDIEVILAIDRLVPTAPHWAVSEYRACLGADNIPQRRLLVAEAGGVIAGYAVGKAAVIGDDGEGSSDVLAEIESIAVLPSARRQGSGGLLCRAMLDWLIARQASEVQLEVRIRSIAAIALYRSLGFYEEGLRCAYYRNPVEDALTMRLDLRAYVEGRRRKAP